MSTDTSDGLIADTMQAMAGRLRALRSHPLLNPKAVTELLRERSGHPVNPEHGSHLAEAIEWLCRAQDSTETGGIARGYALSWHRYFRARGWQAAYPETTGYIIPTLFEAAKRLQRDDLVGRAVSAAFWEVAIQLPSGAVRGGIMGQPEGPAVFNTGQVLLGWIAALEKTDEGTFADAARRAGNFLTRNLADDGQFHILNSAFAAAESSLYNARTGWALAETGLALDEPAFVDAAARHLRMVRSVQHANGWIPQCCLTDGRRPLVHTLAYATRGLLEGGRVLQDADLIDGARLAARAMAQALRPDGYLAGRFDSEWREAVDSSCLTGSAQMANNWIRLYEITGERYWLDYPPRVIAFLKRTQNCTAPDAGLRGGIKGSYPLNGDYGPYQVLSWATKYFADCLMRDDRVSTGAAADPTHRLA